MPKTLPNSSRCTSDRPSRESLRQPLTARGFAPRRRRDGRHFQLPLFQFTSVGAKPGKGVVYAAQLGNARDLLLCGLPLSGAGFGGPFTKKRPGCWAEGHEAQW